jgi:hypothetical protein
MGRQALSVIEQDFYSEVPPPPAASAASAAAAAVEDVTYAEIAPLSSLSSMTDRDLYGKQRPKVPPPRVNYVDVDFYETSREQLGVSSAVSVGAWEDTLASLQGMFAALPAEIITETLRVNKVRAVGLQAVAEPMVIVLCGFVGRPRALGGYVAGHQHGRRRWFLKRRVSVMFSLPRSYVYL